MEEGGGRVVHVRTEEVCVPWCGGVPGWGEGDQVELVDSREVIFHREARAWRAGCHGDILSQNSLAGSLYT